MELAKIYKVFMGLSLFLQKQNQPYKMLTLTVILTDSLVSEQSQWSFSLHTAICAVFSFVSTVTADSLMTSLNFISLDVLASRSIYLIYATKKIFLEETTGNLTYGKK